MGLVRRRALLLAAPALLIGPRVAAGLTPTPPQSEGPFYPRRLPEDRDADLTRFNGGVAPGMVIEVTGRALSARGGGLAGALVECWHCDPDGVYAHVGWRTHPNFQGYGAVRVGADGAWRFRTTRPGLYPGRTRHIHFKVRPTGGRAFATQMYFPGEPGNDFDGLLRRSGDPAALIARAAGGSPPRFDFDIVIA